MSPLAKVFVVLNLVLALGFLGVSATLFTAREKYVASINKMQSDHEKLAAQANQKIDDLEGETKDRRQNEQRLLDQVHDLQRGRDDLINEKGDLVNQIAAKDTDIQNLNNRITQKDTHLEQKDQEISRLTEAKERLMAEAQADKAAKTLAEQLRARAFLDREQVQKALADTNIELATTKRELGDAQDVINIAQAAGLDLYSLVSAKPPPPIDGVVLAVRPDADLVILSVGNNDKVKEGYEFTIYRGPRFIAKVKVLRTTDDLAGARILYQEGATIVVGDKASTRIGN